MGRSNIHPQKQKAVRNRRKKNQPRPINALWEEIQQAVDLGPVALVTDNEAEMILLKAMEHPVLTLWRRFLALIRGSRIIELSRAGGR